MSAPARISRTMRSLRQRQRFWKSKGKTLRLLDFLLVLLIFFVLIAIILRFQNTSSAQAVITGRATIIDGDTVRIAGKRIRLKGIDAPEIKQLCRLDQSSVQCGHQSRTALADKIGSAAIRCEISGTDKYERALGTCFLGTVDLNQWMVEQGWAVSYGAYQTEEQEARKNRRGIWASTFEAPRNWRRQHERRS